MNLKNYLQTNLIFLDGGMGTLLQQKGLKMGELPERWNLSNPTVIKDIHKSYLNSGANIICANTFGANILKFTDSELKKIIFSAIKNAKDAICECDCQKNKWVALDIGPLGKMLKPYGDIEFEKAVEIFAKTVIYGKEGGADLVFIETMTDCYETKAALLATKENCDLPVFVSNAYSSDGKLLTGASPEVMISMLEGLNADAIGVNCSLGPKDLEKVVLKYLKYSSLPIILKPNAGLPKVVDGKTFYDVSEYEFSCAVKKLVQKGVRLIGGCCGTTPKYISELYSACKDIEPKKISKKSYTVVSSKTNAVFFQKTPILIGERINPTGKKLFKQALINSDIDYILKEGTSQEDKGVHVLDVNVGLPGIDEVSMLTKVVSELQAIVNTPLQIDTSSYVAMEKALRIYNGKAIINSVNGTKESMEKVFPLAKKYGGVVVCLTLDENGIPTTCAQRIKIAKKILNTAKQYGISKKDIIFDPLTLTVSADSISAIETLKAVDYIKNKLKCHTVLGVSNVSFGLPKRDFINGSFFTLALAKGLSSAIINPFSLEIMKAYHSYLALNNLDNSFVNYIFFASSDVLDTKITPTQTNDVISLKTAIIKGFKDSASALTKELLKSKNSLDIINEDIIPALDEVGKAYENKTAYLPSLLISAETAKVAFEVIKSSMKNQSSNEKCTFVIATVKGDIHDIGKNIVKLLLENYGYRVVDLGNDVSPETILDSVLKNNAPLLGLSALMTTTVKSMEQTISLVKKHAPWCKIIVGGAVLTKDYADSIGADKYCRDGLDAVKYANEIWRSL